MPKKFILASTSPRRKQIFKLFEINFKIVDPKYREVHKENTKPEDLVLYLALGKAQAVEKKYNDAVIIAADSLVALGSKIFAKPKNGKDAVKMLGELSGKENVVYTAVVVLDSGTKKVFSEVSKTYVKFKELTKEDIQEYVKTKEPLGRAGAYALQGFGFDLIEKISGSITGGIGLPLESVFKGLKSVGVKFMEK